MGVDYILNGKAYGPLAEMVANQDWQPGLARPFFDERGQQFCVINGSDGKPRKVRRQTLVDNGLSVNATLLRKNEWIRFDEAVQMARRDRLRAWADLVAAAPYSGFDGMAYTILEHETTDDPGEAFEDMDMLTEGRNFAPKYQLEGTPLVITHSGCHIGMRKLRTSRKMGMPLDTRQVEAATRRVNERIERRTIGTLAQYAFGGASNYSRAAAVYGYLTYPDRNLLTTLTAPTGENPDETLEDVLEMINVMYDDRFYGPFVLYHSTGWDQYLDNDYILTGGNVATQTLRQRLKAIDVIADVRRLDYLPEATYPNTLILVQLNSEVAQAVIGMPTMLMQWDSKGGAQSNFRVATIQVPRIYSDIDGRCGILIGTTS